MRQTNTWSLVSASRGWSLRRISGAEVSLVGLLEAVAIGVEAAGRVVLTGLCTPLRRRLHRPGEGERRGGQIFRQTEIVRGEDGEDKEEKCNQTQTFLSLFLCIFPQLQALRAYADV